MKENIDLTKILKDCPIGWEFYSSIYGNVNFRRIENNTDYPIVFFFIDKDGITMHRSVTKKGLDVAWCDGECTFFPSKNQRDWSKFTAPWYKNDKFDPKTLKPFDRVIVRDSDKLIWKCNIFSHIKKCTVKQREVLYYSCIYEFWNMCIPYNDDTKHLVGTTDEAPEYYRYWED